MGVLYPFYEFFQKDAHQLAIWVPRRPPCQPRRLSPLLPKPSPRRRPPNRFLRPRRLARTRRRLVEWPPSPRSSTRRALRRKIVKGPRGTKVRKVRTKVRFHRPKTLHLPRTPKFSRKSAPRRSRMDAWGIIKHPLTTESAMKKIEDHNTLVFLVHTKV